VFYEVDVTDRAQIDTALADIHSRFGPVTIWGRSSPAPPI